MRYIKHVFMTMICICNFMSLPNDCFAGKDNKHFQSQRDTEEQNQKRKSPPLKNDESSQSTSSRTSEKIPLLSSHQKPENLKDEDDEIDTDPPVLFETKPREQELVTTNPLPTLIRILGKKVESSEHLVGQTSAAVVYSCDKLQFQRRDTLDDPNYTANLPYITLHKIDNILFDDQKSPRVLLKCCHPAILKFLKLTGGTLGMTSLCLVAPGFTNGLLGEIFNYPPYGKVSIGIMISSALLNSDVAFLQFYDLTNWFVMKPRSTFQSARSSQELYDSDNNDDGVYIFPDSRLSQFMKYVGIPLLSAGYASSAVGLWLDVETGFWDIALPLSLPMLLFYGKSYFQMAHNLWNEVYLRDVYIKSHESREQRRALLQSLKQMKEALIQDTKYTLTQAMWKPVATRTNHFGAIESPDAYDLEIIVSGISCLLSRSAAIFEEEELGQHNRLTSRLSIQEDTTKDKIFRGISTIVMALNLYPNFMMVSETIETLTSLPELGYSAGAVLSILLLIEAKNFEKWLHKSFTPQCCDPNDPILRFVLRRKNNLYTLVNTAIFLADYYFSMSGESLNTLWFFIPFVALRFWAFFDMFSENLDDQVISSFARRNKLAPTPSQMNKQLLEFINRAETLIDHKFTDPVIDRITQAIFKTG